MRSDSRLPFSRGRRAQQGFTLLEMTVAMSFVGLLAAGITLTISTCLNVWQRSVEAAELNQEARAVMELLSRDIGGTYLGLERMTGYLVGSSAAEGEPPVDALVVCTESSISRAALVPQELQATWSPERHPPVTDYVVASYQWLPAAEEAPEGLYRTIRLVPAGYAEPASDWESGSDWETG
ncbi:MAG: prepilin-type N-terminal cleavage/methylation domain-containing protein, partial [Armatimonadota bacterium]|nr:prepilin-type N-terminal cleavage/methylation domain-containing protein [Armatimonadota bacterium]